MTHVCSVPVYRATFVRFNEYDFRPVAYPLERMITPHSVYLHPAKKK